MVAAAPKAAIAARVNPIKRFNIGASLFLLSQRAILLACAKWTGTAEPRRNSFFSQRSSSRLLLEIIVSDPESDRRLDVEVFVLLATGSIQPLVINSFASLSTFVTSKNKLA